ncbi:MAG: dTDP-4-dehydrorhamnose reductase [Litorilinea sp.]
MRVLIVGSQGQLGQALLHVAAQQPKLQAIGWQRRDHDITVPDIARAVAQLGPDLVINTAAYTQVDKAEAEPDVAYAANTLGPKYLAEGCRACGAPLVHISTNEVFAGTLGYFYREYDQPQAGGVYARSKLAGEVAVRQIWDRLYTVRVAWLFGRGTGDFPAKILQAAAGRDVLKVVADEFGNPTYAPHVATAIFELVNSERFGTYHLVNEGWTSRFEWTQYLFEQIACSTRLEAITAAEWPRAVTPPPHAVLVNQAAAALDIRLPTWQAAVREYVESGVLTRTGGK